MASKNATIEDILKIIFPRGTRPDDNDTVISHKEPPLLAADIFAFSGYLVQLSGLMGYFCPAGTSLPCHISINEKDRKACMRQSEQWRTEGKFPSRVTKLWKIIYAAKVDSIMPPQAAVEGTSTEPAKSWWTAIFQLIIIADEACDGIGHYYDSLAEESDEKWAFWDATLYRARLADGRARNEKALPLYDIAAKGVATLGFASNRAVVCVQPKGRVAQLGSSIRNLTRNLALTGPVGSVRCSWQQLAGGAKHKEALRDAMNILLIPLPTKIQAKAFKPINHAEKKWGNFEIEQQWIKQKVRERQLLDSVADVKEYADFENEIVALVKAALNDVDQIDAIVFPEMALTAAVFGQLMHSLSTHKDLPPIKFMISGTKGNCKTTEGNHVMVAVNEALLVDPTNRSQPKNAIRLFSQRKHHRWRLEQNQISSYGLGSALSPSKIWWEDHHIGTRELNFFQLRRDTIIASLICEDLARNDPCHDIMRSVAPNLVFALLMDGPQLINRWPARYASTLADDPGSTVITLTSFGLVERSNDQFSDGKKSRSIGLIRDGRGTTKEIIYPENASAVVLTLGSEKVTDLTIDGRPTTNASEWYYISQRPVAADDKKHRSKDVKAAQRTA